jgi:TPR repeat protein
MKEISKIAVTKDQKCDCLEKFQAETKHWSHCARQNGQGVEASDEEAVNYYRAAADEGHASAMFNLGMMYHNGHGVVRDAVQAESWLSRAASEGDAQAALVLAELRANR